MLGWEAMKGYLTALRRYSLVVTLYLRGPTDCTAHASTVLHALFTWATLYHFINFRHRYLLWDWYCCDTNPSGTHWCRFCCDRWLLCCFMTVVILSVGLWQGRGVAILALHVPHFADYQRCDTLWQTDNPSTSLVIRHGWFPWPSLVWYRPRLSAQPISTLSALWGGANSVLTAASIEATMPERRWCGACTAPDGCMRCA